MDILPARGNSAFYEATSFQQIGLCNPRTPEFCGIIVNENSVMIPKRKLSWIRQFERPDFSKTSKNITKIVQTQYENT